MRRGLLLSAMAAAALSLPSLGLAAGGEPEINTAQLSLNAAHGQRAEVRLGTGQEVYTLGAGAKGFAISHNDRDVLTVSGDGEVTVRADVLQADTLTAANLVVGGVPQWRMASMDVFGAVSPADAGWENGKDTLQCAGLTLLVGQRNPLQSSFAKAFSALPEHNQVRVQATVHFVDDWQGDTAYLKVNGEYVWTFSHDQRNSKGAINLCGSATFPESRFSVPIDVALPHTGSALRVEFGSTLEVGAPAHLGLSSLSLSLRGTPPPKEVVQAVEQVTAPGAQ